MVEADLKEILDDNEKFVKSLGKDKDIHPQLVVCKNKKLSIFLVVGGREEIRLTMDLIQLTKPDWVVFMCSSFAGQQEHIEGYEEGSLKKRFKAGDKTVKEIIVIQAYAKHGKIMRTLEQKTHKKFYDDVEEFSGYLTFDDLQRIFR